MKFSYQLGPKNELDCSLKRDFCAFETQYESENVLPDLYLRHVGADWAGFGDSHGDVSVVAATTEEGTRVD